MWGKYPGFLKRKFGSTTWGKTLVMCGISMEVHDAFVQELSHVSSQALRIWSGERREVKDWYQAMEREVEVRIVAPPSPVSGDANL